MVPFRFEHGDDVPALFDQRAEVPLAAPQRFLGLFQTLLARGDLAHHALEGARLLAQLVVAASYGVERRGSGVVFRLHAFRRRRDPPDRAQ